MAELAFEPIWTAKLKGKELTLIRKALRGELTPEEKDEARALELALAQQTVKRTKQHLDATEKLASNIGEG